MDFDKYFQIIYERKWIVLLSIAVNVVISIFFSYVLMIPKYNATAKIVINRESLSTMEPVILDQNKLNSMVKNEKTAKLAMKNIGIKNISNESAYTLFEQVDVNGDDQGFVRITNRGTNPKECANIANAFADAFVELTNQNARNTDKIATEFEKKKHGIGQFKNQIAEQLEGEKPNTETYARLTFEKEFVDEFDKLINKHYTLLLKNTPKQSAKIVKKAQVPTEPFYPNRKKNIATGLLIGILLGVYAAFLLEARKITDEKAKSNSSRNYR